MPTGPRGRMLTDAERREWERFGRSLEPLAKSGPKRAVRRGVRPEEASAGSRSAVPRSARSLSPDEIEDWETYLAGEKPRERAEAGSRPCPQQNAAKESRRATGTRAPLKKFQIGEAVQDPNEDWVGLSGGTRGKSAASPVDRKLLRQLKSGKAAPEAQIDLHGKTCAEAEHAVNFFMAGASRAGKRIVLIITGKGRENGHARIAGERKGIIRDMVPKWLSAPCYREIVWHFESAQPRHGGSGAFYVFLKRRRGGG